MKSQRETERGERERAKQKANVYIYGLSIKVVKE